MKVSGIRFNKVNITNSKNVINYSENKNNKSNYSKEQDLLPSYKMTFKGIVSQIDDSVNSRISKLNNLMEKENIDALLIPSTDNYLTESITDRTSYITGYTGVGNVVITPDKSRLIVDGRYHIQAEKQADKNLFKVEKIGLDENGKRIEGDNFETRIMKMFSEMSRKNPNKTLRIGYDASQISVLDFLSLEKRIKDEQINVELVATKENLVDKIRLDKPNTQIHKVRELPLDYSGASSTEKLKNLRAMLKSDNIDMLTATNLGDIAYITNLRGTDIDYNTVFKSKMIITQNRAIVFCDLKKIPLNLQKNHNSNFEFKGEEEFDVISKQIIDKAENGFKVAISSDTTNYATYKTLKNVIKNDMNLIAIDESPIMQMRLIKNDTELSIYETLIKRTDVAITEVMARINQKTKKGDVISETDLEDLMLECHLKNGAIHLSFPTIPAAGTNGALIHYEKGDPNVFIKKGDLVLLDTGAFYKEGLATDITRTWIAGGKSANPTLMQKEIYTTVLKGALNGLFADLPPGTTGKDIDNIVRRPIAQKGYDYLHSTGHGIGIEEHELPFISPRAKNAVKELKKGMVFSIEPGIYIKNWGGVRFENLVTIIEHPDKNKAAEGWHKIKCLSFAPIDMHLLDKRLLNEYEQECLKIFIEKSKKILLKNIK